VKFSPFGIALDFLPVVADLVKQRQVILNELQKLRRELIALRADFLRKNVNGLALR